MSHYRHPPAARAASEQSCSPSPIQLTGSRLHEGCQAALGHNEDKQEQLAWDPGEEPQLLPVASCWPPAPVQWQCPIPSRHCNSAAVGPLKLTAHHSTCMGAGCLPHPVPSAATGSQWDWFVPSLANGCLHVGPPFRAWSQASLIEGTRITCSPPLPSWSFACPGLTSPFSPWSSSGTLQCGVVV